MNHLDLATVLIFLLLKTYATDEVFSFHYLLPSIHDYPMTLASQPAPCISHVRGWLARLRKGGDIPTAG